MHYLEYKDIVQINVWVQNITEKQIKSTLGIRELNVLKSIPESIQQTFDGIELYPTLQDKAICLWVSLSRYHCFVDGNKRTALMTFIVFLEMNNYSIDIRINEIYEICMKLAINQIEKKYVENYLAQILRENQEKIQETFSVSCYLNKYKNDANLIKLLIALGE